MTIGEKNLKDLSYKELATKMAVVLTQRAKPELMTCRDVVGTGRYPYTGKLGILSPEDKAIVQQSLAQVGGLDFADRPFANISDGQRQRLMLARAICQDTKILILDEPTSYLDMGFKMDILTNIRMLARDKKMAVIMSLHELDLAQKVSDTVACVRGDRIDRIGTPEEIFTREYIAKLYRMEHGKYDPCFDSLEFVP